MRGLSAREYQHDLGYRWPTGWFERMQIRRAATSYTCDGCGQAITKGERHGASRNNWSHVCLTCLTTRSGEKEQETNR